MGMRMNERCRRVMALFNAGLAPSEIDRMLKIPSGTAHWVIVAAWAYDKEMAKQSAIESNWK